MSKEVVIINQTYTGMSSDVNPVILEWNTLPDRKSACRERV